MKFIKLLTIGLLTGFLLDMLWLGIIAKGLYEENIGFLLRKANGNLSPNWLAATLVYLAIVIGIIVFVIPKANGNAFYGFLWGAVFGAVTYGVYDFTNYAIINAWPLKITLIDFFWGMALCGIISAVTVYFTK